MQPIQARYSLAALDLAGYDPTKGHPTLSFVPSKQQPVKTRASLSFQSVRKTLEQAYFRAIPFRVRSYVTLAVASLGHLCNLIERTIKVVKPILDGGRYVVQAALTEASPVWQAARKLKIVGLFTLGSTVSGLVENGKKLHRSIQKGNIDASVDRGLGIVENWASIFGTAEAALSVFQEFGILAASEAVTLAGNSLMGVGAALSVATLILNAKLWAQSVQFQKHLFHQFAQEPKLEAFFSCINQQSGRVLENRIGVGDGREFKLKMGAIQKKIAQSSTEDAGAIKQGLKGALEKRFLTKQLSYGLKVLAAAISIIGVAILLFTPLAPVAFTLLAVCSAIGIALLIGDYFSEKAFNQDLDSLAGWKSDADPKLGSPEGLSQEAVEASDVSKEVRAISL